MGWGGGEGEAKTCMRSPRRGYMRDDDDPTDDADDPMDDDGAPHKRRPETSPRSTREKHDHSPPPLLLVVREDVGLDVDRCGCHSRVCGGGCLC